MARTKQEVRNFLNGLVGQKVNPKCGVYNGQCVSLIKALLEFLGAPNPYGARGNAKDVGDTLLREGIASKGNGWLMVCVNRSMGNIGGVTYGHIWLDLSNEANYEQNGASALHTTKNTRPISQAQQIVNLDKYIKEPEAKVSYVPMDVPRVMIAKKDLKKFDGDKKAYVGDVMLPKGDGRLFLKKFSVNGKLYVQTEFDSDSKTHQGFAYSDLEDGTPFETSTWFALRALNKKAGK